VLSVVDGLPKKIRALILLGDIVCQERVTGRWLQPGDLLPSFMLHDFDEQSWERCLEAFQLSEDELPLHYYTHLMHGAEVLGL
jgi:hypothetical protein